MTISEKALAAVRDEIISSYYNDKHRIFFGFMGGSACNFDSKAIRRKAKWFIDAAFIFNSIEWQKGEQARNNCEPIDWGIPIRHVEGVIGAKLSPAQFLMTLQMIDYNTDPDGWMTKAEYSRWARKDEFENFKKILTKMISRVALTIVEQTEEYKKAEWCI